MFKHKSVPTSVPSEFINLQPVSPLMSKGVAKVLYLGANRNGSYFTKDVVNKMIPSLYGVPIVGKYEPGKGDFLGHEKEVVVSLGKQQVKAATYPYGYVPENARVWYQTFKDDDQVEREYLCCDVRMWTGRYPEAYRAVTKGNHQSMEIDPETMMGDWAIADNQQSEYFMVSEAYFSALCILGEDVEPCFEGAGIAHEFNLLSKQDRAFLYELDKSIEKVKGEYNMDIEDLKLILEAASNPSATQLPGQGLPTNANVKPADEVVTPPEGLATDANFEDNDMDDVNDRDDDQDDMNEKPETDCALPEEEDKKPEQPGEPAPAPEAPAEPEKKPEGEPEAPKKEEGAEPPAEPKPEGEDNKPPFPPKEEGEEQPVPMPGEEDPMAGVPNAANASPTDGLDPVGKIDQIMLEDKDILEAELLKKILELLQGKMAQPQPGVVPPVDNAGGLPQQAEQTPTAVTTQVAPQAPIPQTAPQMPAEIPAEVEQIKRQFELEIEQKTSEYEALETKYNALMGEFNKLQEFKLQVEMNEKEAVIAQYSMLDETVVKELKEKAKDLSKDDLEARCALALVKSSKNLENDNKKNAQPIVSFSYSQAPQDDFLAELDKALGTGTKK